MPSSPTKTFARARFIVVPSAACPAQCTYCFGPHAGPVMSRGVWDATLRFIESRMAAREDPLLRLTFHGGEPLMAGMHLFERALPMLAVRFPKRDITVQSNLWLLDEALCRLFRDHAVHLSTSLDGPKPITDRQRGPGYFERTMRGIDLARNHGLGVGCVATFTERSAPRWREVFDFFVAQRLDFAVHAAVPSFAHPHSSHVLSPAGFGRLLTEVLPYYVEHRHEVSVSPFDEMGGGILTGKPLLCTFGDCLGLFLVIDPVGDIYPCQRFCGNPEFAMGNVRKEPSDTQLLDSAAAQRLHGWRGDAAIFCDDCANAPLCAGGCPYNALASGLNHDPYCSAYQAAFDAMRSRLLKEAAQKPNLHALAEAPQPDTIHRFFRRGPLIDICRAAVL